MTIATRACARISSTTRIHNNPEYDTEEVYFDLLREIGRKIELRVVVDIIAGASAGGINGAMLARALCHNLPINALRDMWLDNADVTVSACARGQSRTPGASFSCSRSSGSPTKYGMVAGDKEVVKKLSLFVRSRWFKPPLDGHVMDALMYDAADCDGRSQQPAGIAAALRPRARSVRHA